MKGAFIDRDGVIIEERGYAFRLEDFALLPGAVAALRDLQSAGYALVVVTNQSGIARGLYAEADYLSFSAHMEALLGEQGVRLDAVEYCPHLPDAPVARYRLDCNCRKPRPEMLQRAAGRLGIDLVRSVLVGDRRTDIQAGRAAGVSRCFLVRSGQSLAPQDEALADGVFENLAACVQALLGDSAHS
ncbi:MAG TPA: HAD family hydrolase [Steroidobacteraceae bacterium]|nr:HAD family hydrolase [Steroidobacteraceae bacterium]